MSNSFTNQVWQIRLFPHQARGVPSRRLRAAQAPGREVAAPGGRRGEAHRADVRTRGADYLGVPVAGPYKAERYRC
ncbi:MAG: adenosylhomocysteinase [Nocardioides sp.]